ncbi:hypothetical protein JCM10908_002838 [Rhodotorula pacifica]|uniref:alpha/beta fold hydrolase n=1 Tax=Rhodotorula pacifica TaxID=1495444 RepID=UPI003176BD16
MPHLHLPGTTVQIWYDFPNDRYTPNSTKPSVILLAPSMLNATFLDPYVEALRDDYALTVVELRGLGRTIGGQSPDYDYWVAAADIAFLMNALQLPPSHIFAPGFSAFRTAIQFSILFPDQALSLSLVGAMSLFGPPRNAEAFQEVDAVWSNPEDEDLFVECLGAVGEYVLTESSGREDVWDRAIPAIARHCNPFRQANIFLNTRPNQGCSGITPALLTELRQPILLIHGGRDLCFPIEDIEEIRQHLTGSPDVRFYIEEDAPQLLAITHVESVVPRLRQFLNDHRHLTHPNARFDPLDALKCASRVTHNEEVAQRDPHCPDSFSLLADGELRANQILWDKMMPRENACTLDLPMCHEKDDWEEGAKDQPRWTWSTRHEYAQQHYSRRPSLPSSLSEDGIQVVEVTESRSAAHPRIPNGMTAARTSFIDSRRSSADVDAPTADAVRAMSALRV